MTQIDFLTMQYTLGDVLMIIGYVGGLIATYVVITSRITRLEVRLDSFRETVLDKLLHQQAAIDKNKSEIDADRRYTMEKLALIESGQTKTNVFLEENLKNLTRIITLHEKQIGAIDSKLNKYDQNISDFYRDYDLTKREKK